MTTARRCLVLGGRGFIGSHLVDGLLAAGWNVRCFDRLPPGLSAAEHPRLEHRTGDFGNEEHVAEALGDCEVCYHLVSTTLPKTSNEDPVYDVESNVVATLKMLRRAVQAGVRKVVFVSSGGTVYGVPSVVPIPESHSTDPTCSYGIGKLAIEKYLALFKQLHGVDYAVLRLSNPFGERQRTHASQGAVAVFVGKVLCGEPVEIWGDGSVVRDYIHIADVVEALILAQGETRGETLFNIGSGKGLSINQVLDAVGSVTGKPVQRRYLPARTFDVPASVLSIERARSVLGWSPRVSFEDGLARFTQWVQNTPGAL
jgi:UDP-glucose 4-epimerase